MGTRVHFFEDPAQVMSLAGDYLLSRPVLHNILLTVLDARIRWPEPARYWVATQDSEVKGVVLQSPLNYRAAVSVMDTVVVNAMVDAIVQGNVALPGVSGDAATAASFAGQWTERS